MGLAEGALWCDALAFQQAMDEGRLTDPLELYRGDLLEGLFVSDAAPEFYHWLDAERARLRGRAMDAARALNAGAEAAGKGGGAIRWARRAFVLDPYERAVRRLIALLDEAGDRAGALRTYDELARRLAREFETEPSAETRALIEGIRELRWSDVSFQTGEFGQILWRKELDKKGYQMSVPITKAVREALLALRRQSSSIGDGWIFPAPKDPEKPCSRHLLDSWLRRAYDAAGLKPQAGGMWHPFRRRWATLRKHYPVKDLAKTGGWKTVEAVQKSYLTEDAETIRNIVLNPTNSLKRPPGQGGNSQQTRNAEGET